MATQILREQASVLNSLVIPIGDFGVEVDANGNATGGIRIGTGVEVGGLTVSGVVGSGAVSSVNGQTGIVSLGSADLTDVTLSAALADGNVLRYRGAEWVNEALSINDLDGVDTASTLPTNGQALVFNAQTRTWIPGTVQGSGDNLGNHTATTSLQMSGNRILGALGLTMVNGWGFENPNSQSFTFARNGSNVLTLTASDTVGSGFFVLRDYGAARASDVPTFTPDNFAYFAPSGGMLKASMSQVSVTGFMGISSTAATTGQALVWNGTEYAPATVTGSGGSTTVAGLSDVEITGIADGEFMAWSAANSRFERATATFDGSVANLTEVLASTPAANDSIFFNGSAWVIGQSAAAALGGLSNVSSSAPNDGDVLSYFSGSGQWAPRAALVTDFDVSAPAAGDMMYFTGAVWSRIPVGTDGQTLTLVGGVPTWS